MLYLQGKEDFLMIKFKTSARRISHAKQRETIICVKKVLMTLMLLFAITAGSSAKDTTRDAADTLNVNVHVVMKDGTVYDGHVYGVNIYTMTRLKVNVKGEWLSLKGKDVDYFELMHDGKPTARFRYIPTNFMYGNSWCLSLAEGEHVKVMLRQYDHYYFRDDGSFTVTAKITHTVFYPIFAHFNDGKTKYAGILYPKMTGTKGGLFNRTRIYSNDEYEVQYWKKLASKAFKKDKALSKEIKEGKLTFEDLEEVVRRYTPDDGE